MIPSGGDGIATATLVEIAARIAAPKLRHPSRAAIDGRTAAGKKAAFAIYERRCRPRENADIVVCATWGDLSDQAGSEDPTSAVHRARR